MNRGRSGSQSVPTHVLYLDVRYDLYCGSYFDVSGHSVTRSDRQRRDVSGHGPLCHSVSAASSPVLRPGFWSGDRATRWMSSRPKHDVHRRTLPLCHHRSPSVRGCVAVQVYVVV